MSENNPNVIVSEKQSVDISQFFNPFPGLRPFGIEEAHLFFGREGQSDEVLMKLADNRFAAILGSSGSGKSSLMFCGLIPTLYGGFMTEAGSNWRVIVMRPGAGPIDNLAESLLLKDKHYNEADEEDQLIKKTITSTVLRTSSLGLIEAIKQLRSVENENFFILVDQFEELFRYKRIESATSNMDESSAFVNLLLEAVNQYDIPIYVALTMRSDFIGECAVFPELTQMINDSHYLIPQMTRDQKRLAVEGPVAVGGGQISGRLIQQLLNDVGDNPDQLPILQHALMRTWAYWSEDHKDEEPMDLRHYNAIGTLREALSQHANEAYDSLSKREKQICEAMFKALTERGSENQGIRRPTKLGTIAAIAGVSEEEVMRVVEKFREPGRTLLMPPYGVELTSETVIDISHESLMRIWIRLKTWLDEEAKSSEMYGKIAEAAERYQLGRAGLWKMPDLQLALNWQEETKPTIVWGQRYNTAFERTMVFLETSTRAYETEQRNKEFLQKRAIRNSKIFALSMAGAALVAIFFVVYANIARAEADKQTIAAQENLKAADIARAEATKNLEEAEIQKQAALDANKIANENLIAATEANAEAQRQTLEAQRQAVIALEAQQRAEQSEKDAVVSAQKATQSAIEADSARATAVLAQQNAENLRFRAIAQSMAIKSTQQRDPVTQGLVAMQAFKFFEQYKDPAKPYNGDIYVGVFQAMKKLYGDSLNTYEGHSKSVRSVIYSHNNHIVYSAGSDGKILQWEIGDADDHRNYTEIFNDEGINRHVDVSRDDRWLAAGLEDRGMVLIDLKNPNAEKKYFNPHGGTVYDLAFLPDNSGIVSVGLDGLIKKTTLNGVTSEIASTAENLRGIAISPNGNQVAAANLDGLVEIWDLENNNAQRTLYVDENESPIDALAFSEDGKYLAFGTEDGGLTIYDLDSKTIFYEDAGAHASMITDLEFSKDNNLLATTSRDGTAKVWVLDNIFELPTTLDDHGQIGDWVWAVSFAPDGSHLMTAADDDHLRLWPTLPHEWASRICDYMGRNMNQNEWRKFVGEDIEYREDPAEITCPEYPGNNNAGS